MPDAPFAAARVDRILVNGRFITADADFVVAEAVAMAANGSSRSALGTRLSGWRHRRQQLTTSAARRSCPA